LIHSWVVPDAIVTCLRVCSHFFCPPPPLASPWWASLLSIDPHTIPSSSNMLSQSALPFAVQTFSLFPLGIPFLIRLERALAAVFRSHSSIDTYRRACFSRSFPLISTRLVRSFYFFKPIPMTPLRGLFSGHRPALCARDVPAVPCSQSARLSRSVFWVSFLPKFVNPLLPEEIVEHCLQPRRIFFFNRNPAISQSRI